MKNLIKTIITTVLVAAITITNISVDTITATAKTTNGGEFTNGGTITLKLGDTIRLLVTDTNNEFPDSYINDYDIVSNYKWSSSDKSILKVETDLYNEREGYTECVELTGVGIGTTTVTGKAGGKHHNITMTVNVTLPKATTKQQKCKHKYKITKKSTCERSGIKTCKKCKFQKSTAKIDHKYVDRHIITLEYDYFIEDIHCTACDCTEPHFGETCSSQCLFTAYVKYDKYGNVSPDSDYPSNKAALDAIDDHFISTAGRDTPMHGTWGAHFGVIPYGEGHKVTKTVKACKYCNKYKEPMPTQAEQVYALIEEKAANQ